MSLQQALLARVPLAQKQAELQKVIACNRKALKVNLAIVKCPHAAVIAARQAFFVAQDQLRRL